MPKQLNHRSRSEIIASILEAGLSSFLKLEYLAGERAFKTTPKGMQVLMTYSGINKVIRFSNLW
jgi:predicted transcriptional regulator